MANGHQKGCVISKHTHKKGCIWAHVIFYYLKWPLVDGQQENKGRKIDWRWPPVPFTNGTVFD